MGATAQRGIALVTSLLMLIVMTLLALSMFRSIGLDESIAGNTREKQRSLQSAESALNYGEWWLSQGNGGPNASANACSTVYTANTATNVQICTNALASPTTLPWSARGDYLPPSMTVTGSGGVVSPGGDINYYAKPSLYIYALGTDPSGRSQLYQVTGAGYGGSANGASVVQSVYAITQKITSLDQ